MRAVWRTSRVATRIASPRVRRVALVLLATLLLGACGPVVAMFGDSNTARSADSIRTALEGQNGDYIPRVYGEPWCGLLPNADCTIDWSQLIADDRDQMQPDVYVVALGLDDALWQTDAALADYGTSIDQFVELLDPPGGRQVPILWMNLPIIQSTKHPGTPERIATINAALDAAAQRWPDVLTVVDMRDVFTPHYPDWWVSDGLHLNATGQAEFGALVRQSVDQLEATTTTTTTSTTTTSTTTSSTTTVPSTTTTTSTSTTTVPTTAPTTTTTAGP